MQPEYLRLLSLQASFRGSCVQHIEHVSGWCGTLYRMCANC